MFVKVVAGRKVVGPSGTIMPTDEGFEININDLFWARVLHSGDVVQVQAGGAGKQLTKEGGSK